jgi:hypothetical protein
MNFMGPRPPKFLSVTARTQHKDCWENQLILESYQRSRSYTQDYSCRRRGDRAKPFTPPEDATESDPR